MSNFYLNYKKFNNKSNKNQKENFFLKLIFTNTRWNYSYNLKNITVITNVTNISKNLNN